MMLLSTVLIFSECQQNISLVTNTTSHIQEVQFISHVGQVLLQGSDRRASPHIIMRIALLSMTFDILPRNVVESWKLITV